MAGHTRLGALTLLCALCVTNGALAARGRLGLPGRVRIWSRRLALELHVQGVGLRARSVGISELLGARYRIWHPYQAEVSPELTRGSRLSAVRVRKLAARGFRSVVALTLESTSDRGPARASGLRFLHLGILDNGLPSRRQVLQFLDFLGDPNHTPAYVHCQAGIGRTGIMVAAYRMAYQGWSAVEALKEARYYGLRLPHQRRIIRTIWRDLQAGRYPGYPRASGQQTGSFVSQLLTHDGNVTPDLAFAPGGK
jgi:hypothetical protein